MPSYYYNGTDVDDDNDDDNDDNNDDNDGNPDADDDSARSESGCLSPLTPTEETLPTNGRTSVFSLVGENRYTVALRRTGQLCPGVPQMPWVEPSIASTRHTVSAPEKYNREFRKPIFSEAHHSIFRRHWEEGRDALLSRQRCISPLRWTRQARRLYILLLSKIGTGGSQTIPTNPTAGTM